MGWTEGIDGSNRVAELGRGGFPASSIVVSDDARAHFARNQEIGHSGTSSSRRLRRKPAQSKGKEHLMGTYKRNARIIGGLFILATVLAIVGGSLLLPLDEPGYLVEAANAESQIVLGALLEIAMAVSVVGIAAMFFPVLRRQDEGLGLGYLGARILEAVLLGTAAICSLVILTLGMEFGSEAGGLGDLMLAVREWTYLLGSLAFLGLGGLVLYTLLYQSRLVPRWLSIWGLLAAALILARGLLEAFGIGLSGMAQGVLAAPIAIQEMVLAGWLIVKGFDTSFFAHRSVREEVLTNV